MGRLRRKVPLWVWKYLEEDLILDGPRPTGWFVDKLALHWEHTAKDRVNPINNKYWDCSTQGVHPILRQAGYRVVGQCRASKHSLWVKKSS
ncbi:MAG: hypothetical protein CMF52_02770 [Legionellales bacterium]|nr:hypothetical protein [Legionellales bacterium]